MGKCDVAERSLASVQLATPVTGSGRHSWSLRVTLPFGGSDGDVIRTTSGTALNGTAIVQDMQMTFRPRSDASVPRKFVYSNRRLVNVEVPFTLKDVPLP